MSDHPNAFTIHARVRHADWPGGRALCSVLTAPGWLAEMWFLSSGETGRTAVLERYQFGMFAR